MARRKGEVEQTKLLGSLPAGFKRKIPGQIKDVQYLLKEKVD